MSDDQVISVDTTTTTLSAVTARAAEAAAALAETSPAERATWLGAVARAVESHGAELVDVADEETSLGRGRLEGEVVRTVRQLELFADVLTEGSFLGLTIDHARPDLQPPRPDLRRMLHPLGPVGVFTAGNFPFAFSIAGGDTASALAAGCPVVVKAHPGHLRLSELSGRMVDEALRAAGAPAGTFAVVGGLETGRRLVTDPAIKAVAFTGSNAGGRALFDLAASRPDPIPFYGELGSINPVAITPGAAAARAEQLAQGLVGSFTLGVGQFCTKPGIVFVPTGGPMAAAVRTAMGESRGGAMLSEHTAASFHDRRRELVADHRTTLVAGGGDDDASGTHADPLVLQVAVADLLDARELLLAECFGPLTLLVEYADEGELRRAVDELPGALTFTVHAEDGELEALRPLIATARRLAGRVVYGGWPTGVAVTWAQHHGGPWPATTSPLYTSVGATAIERFLRPVAYQDVPQALLPPLLRDDAVGVPRRVDGVLIPG